MLPMPFLYHSQNTPSSFSDSGIYALLRQAVIVDQFKVFGLKSAKNELMMRCQDIKYPLFYQEHAGGLDQIVLARPTMKGFLLDMISDLSFHIN